MGICWKHKLETLSFGKIILILKHEKAFGNTFGSTWSSRQWKFKEILTRELKYQNVIKIKIFETLDNSKVDNEFYRRTLCVELFIIHNLWVFRISNEQ